MLEENKVQNVGDSSWGAINATRNSGNQPKSPPPTGPQQQSLDSMQISSSGYGNSNNRSNKRKSRSDSPTPPIPVPSAPVVSQQDHMASPSARSSSLSAINSAVGEGYNQQKKRDFDAGLSAVDPTISCLQGSTMRIPLGGKSVPFEVVRRRGAGISSVVFECRREDLAENGGAIAAGDGCPDVVTVKVLSGGEAGMGACLREVETLAYLKIKREEAGLARGQARFAELASWFYRRSAVGGVDHVCLVFRGGGISLREAMQERVPGASAASAGNMAKPPSNVWQPGEVMAVARGILEGLAFLHSAGVIHGDIKPENVALYPPPVFNPPQSKPPTPSATNNIAADTTNSSWSSNPAVVGNSSTIMDTQPATEHDTSTLDTSSSTPSTINYGQPTTAHTAARQLDLRHTPHPYRNHLSPPKPQPRTPPFDLRLIDFGNTLHSCDTIPGKTAGTPSYLSPEAKAGKPWGTPVDIWAVGCILYEIVTGGRVGRAGGVGGGEGVTDLRGEVLEGLVALLKSLLTEDVDRRPSAQEALAHHVFSLA